MANLKDSQQSTVTPVLTDKVRGLDDPGGTPLSVTFLLSAIYTLFKTSFDSVYATVAHSSASAAVHGLPASVYVMGNSDAAASWIQGGSVSVTCPSGTDNVSKTIAFPKAFTTLSTFSCIIGPSSAFANLNESPFLVYASASNTQLVIYMFTRSGTWAADRTATLYWTAIGS